MEQTKLSLSPQEFALVTDSQIILTKNAVLEKVKEVLANLHAWQLNFVKSHPVKADPLFVNTGKISRGENYNGLPYLILDYPRNFGQEDVLAIRSLFWWGKQISVTLHLSGKWKQQVLPKLQEKFAFLQSAGYRFSMVGDEWNHDISGENYYLFSGSSENQWLAEAGNSRFLKIAVVAPIKELENAPDFWRQHFKEFINLLQ